MEKMRRNPVVKVAAAVVLALVVVLLVAYPASSWWIGKKIEEEQNLYYQMLKDTEYQYGFRVVERNYQRGLFSATETVSFEPVSEWLPAGSLEGLRFSLHTEIKHGPFPGFSGVGAGTAETTGEFVMGPALKQQLVALFGDQRLFSDQKALRVHSQYHFGGGGEFNAESPAFKLDFPEDDAGNIYQLTWGGFTLNGYFDKDLAGYALQAELPQLMLARSGGEERVWFNGLRFSGHAKTVFPDIPWFYVGERVLSLAELGVSGLALAGQPDTALRQIEVSGHENMEGEFLNTLFKARTEVIQVADQNYGPANLDFSLKHLHARHWVMLLQTLAQLQEEQTQAAQWQMIQEPLFSVLKNEPVVKLEQLSFTTPMGMSKMSAHARLVGLTEADMEVPAQWPERLEAGAEISLPEAWVLAMVDGNVGSAAIGDNDADTSQNIMGANGEDAMPSDNGSTALPDWLRPYVDDGFIVRQEGMLKVLLTYTEGVLKLNNKPFDPNTLYGPSEDEEMEAEIFGEGEEALLPAER